ncbi:MAG: PIN domain-containing protein [Gemmatimonadaceae bacterium]
MKVGYVDTSCLVALALAEPAAARIQRRLSGFDELHASNLLEAELNSVMLRERSASTPALFKGISWVVPDRPLHAEIARVLEAGYVRGTDCWHLASALYLAREPETLIFLTLDMRQLAVARKLGFQE